jgi:hypothetical protein
MCRTLPRLHRLPVRANPVRLEHPVVPVDLA